LQKHGDDVENPNVGHDVQKNVSMNEGVASGRIGNNIDDL
jgi:hypothetical protein